MLLLLIVKGAVVAVVWDEAPPRQKKALSPRRGGTAQNVPCLSTVALVHTEYFAILEFRVAVVAWKALVEERTPRAAIQSSVAKAEEENFMVAVAIATGRCLIVIK